MGSSDGTTLWGSSSLFVQVTVVPALTLMAAGMNEKLSIVTAEVATAAWATGVVAGAAASGWAWSAVAAWVVACVAPPHAPGWGGRRPASTQTPTTTGNGACYPARPRRSSNGPT